MVSVVVVVVNVAVVASSNELAITREQQKSKITELADNLYDRCLGRDLELCDLVILVVVAAAAAEVSLLKSCKKLSSVWSINLLLVRAQAWPLQLACVGISRKSLGDGVFSWKLLL